MDDKGIKLGNEEVHIRGTYEEKSHDGGGIMITEHTKDVKTSVVAIGFDRVRGAYLEQEDSRIGDSNNLLFYYHKLEVTGKNGIYTIMLSKYTGAHYLK